MTTHQASSLDSVRISVPGGRAVTLPCSLILELYDERKERHRADEAEADARMQRISAARAAITAMAGPWVRGEPAAGRVACPVCKAPGETLRFRRAGSNGHVHATCETPDCVGWME